MRVFTYLSEGHPSYLLLISVGASLLVVQLNQRAGSPVLAIVDRAGRGGSALLWAGPGLPEL